jgi:hypothetical protein
LSSRLQLTGSQLIDTAQLSNLGQLNEAPSFGPDAGQTIKAWFRHRLGCSAGSAWGWPPWLGACTGFPVSAPLLGPEAASRFAERYLTELDRLVSGVTA